MGTGNQDHEDVRVSSENSFQNRDKERQGKEGRKAEKGETETGTDQEREKAGLLEQPEPSQTGFAVGADEIKP